MSLPDAAAEFARQAVISLSRGTVDLDCSCGAELADLQDKLKRQRSLTREVEAKLCHLERDWRRIEQLVDREFTSPESVINRIAVLASADKHRDEAVAENERLARERDRLRVERDDLLHAARAVTRPSTWTATRMATLREVVDRIDKELTGP